MDLDYKINFENLYLSDVCFNGKQGCANIQRNAEKSGRYDRQQGQRYIIFESSFALVALHLMQRISARWSLPS